MAARTRRHGSGGLEAWPGYVDALSTLLMVTIFVLLVFVLAQAFLSVALSGSNKQLDKVNAQLAQLTDALSLERSHSNELQLSVAQLNRQLASVTSARDDLGQQLASLQEQAQQALADRKALGAARDRLTQQLSDANLVTQSLTAQNQKLQARLATVASQADQAGQQNATISAQLTATQQQLADAKAQAEKQAQQNTALTAQLTDTQKKLSETQQQLAGATTQVQKQGQQNTKLSAQLSAAQQKLNDTEQKLASAQQLLADTQQHLADMRQEMAKLNKTVSVDKDTIKAKLSDLATMTEQVRALSALRDQLEEQAQEAAARSVTEAEKRAAVAAELDNEKKLGDSAKAQLALLNQQVDQLKSQLSAVENALDIAQKQGRDKDVQIANLGQKLNAALAAKVEELQQYRSDFFGQLRKVLAGRPGIQVVGDRFVFQSDVLFPVGSADLTQNGISQLTALAVQIKDLIPEIPSDIKWILQVNGYTDPQPVKGGQFTSNWELSTARALSVVQLLIEDGVPPQHLAAAGFGQYQPIMSGDTPEDYAKDRRIELRLTN